MAGSLSRRGFGIGLALIGITALVVRILQVAWVTGHQELHGDALYYYWQANEILHGHWFTQPLQYLGYGVWAPGADHPPGFVTLLALLGSIGLTSPLSQRYALTLLGTVTVLVIAITMRRVLGDRAALIAGAIAAVYPNLWVNDGRIMSETMFLFTFTVALYAFFRFRQAHRWSWLVLLAVALTLAASARPESLLLFPLILVPAVIGATRGEPRRRLAMIAIGAVIPIAAFAPWTIFNSARFDQPVLMSTGAGQTLLQGNCSLTYYTDSIGLNRFTCLTEVDYPQGPRLNFAKRDRRYREVAWEYMREHPRRLPKVVLAREGRTWGVWRVNQQRHVDHYFENRGSLQVIQVQQWTWWLMAVLALPGLVLWRRHRLGLYPLLAQIGVTVVATAITFGSTRYRAGAEICVVFLATATIEYTWRYLRARSTPEPPQRTDPTLVAADHQRRRS